MAIDPKLVSIKTAGELPVSDPSDNANFLFYEGEALKRSPIANIYDKVSSGLLPATTSTVPGTTGFDRYIVHTAGTYTNFLSGGSPIVVTAGDLDVVSGVANNEVILEVDNGVATKRVRRLKGDAGAAGVVNYNTSALSPTSTDKAETGKSISDYLKATPMLFEKVVESKTELNNINVNGTSDKAYPIGRRVYDHSLRSEVIADGSFWRLPDGTPASQARRVYVFPDWDDVRAKLPTGYATAYKKILTANSLSNWGKIGTGVSFSLGEKMGVSGIAIEHSSGNNQYVLYDYARIR